MTPLRVAYLDLGFSAEQYGLQPTRYGGGAVAARYLKEDPEVDFHVFAPAEAFDNVGPTEHRDRCHALPLEVCQWLANGGSLDNVWQGPDKAAGFPFDLILHPHTCTSINRGAFRGPVVHFCGFDGAAGHPRNDYILLYNPTFRAQFGERARYVTIGKPVPAQCPDKPTVVTERPFVLQVSRHDDHMPSIPVAKACLAAGIKAVFAGPIHNGYPLLDYIDGVNTVYLGEIGEAEKLDLYRRARLVALLAEWDLPFSQTIIEAQGQGTPIYVNQRGPFLNRYLVHGVNGFRADGQLPMDLRDAFDLAVDIDHAQCWRAAKAYDTPVMVESFKRAFQSIVAEWRTLHP